MSDAEGLFDLDGEPGKEVAQRVLEREAHHHGTDGRGRQQLLAQQHRGDRAEETDDGHVLDDGGEPIGRPVVAPRVDQQGDDQVDERQDQDEPGQRRGQRPVTQPLADGQLEAEEREEQPGAEHQPAADEAAADGGQQRQCDGERRRAGENQG